MLFGVEIVYEPPILPYFILKVGAYEVHVWPRPRVGVLSTGDELCDVAEHEAGSSGPSIKDSNRPMLIAALRAEGAIVEDLGIVSDRLGELETVILSATSRFDVVVTSGGVSMVRFFVS